MDFWRTITVTFVGFVFSGVVGTWITYFWQNRSWRHQQEYSRQRELLARQITIVEELSDLIGYRKFRMFRAAAALRGRNKEKVMIAWKAYDESVLKWNDTIYGNITKLRQFFGKNVQYRLEHEITSEFQFLGSYLEIAKTNFDNKSTGQEYNGRLRFVSDRLEEFGSTANEFIGDMWRYIDGLRSKIDGRPDISLKNGKQLSYFYLLKNLFAPRV